MLTATPRLHALSQIACNLQYRLHLLLGDGASHVVGRDVGLLAADVELIRITQHHQIDVATGTLPAAGHRPVHECGGDTVLERRKRISQHIHDAGGLGHQAAQLGIHGAFGVRLKIDLSCGERSRLRPDWPTRAGPSRPRRRLIARSRAGKMAARRARTTAPILRGATCQQRAAAMFLCWAFSVCISRTTVRSLRALRKVWSISSDQGRAHHRRLRTGAGDAQPASNHQPTAAPVLCRRRVPSRRTRSSSSRRARASPVLRPRNRPWSRRRDRTATSLAGMTGTR